MVNVYLKTPQNDILLPYYEYDAIQIVEYINSQGGILDYLLKPIMIIKNEIEDLIETIEKYEYSKVLAYFGTTTTAERDALSDILEKQNKLLFSIHLSPAQKCYKNIIQVGPIPHQYSIKLYTSISAITGNCIILSDDSMYIFYIVSDNNQISEYINNVGNNLNSVLPTQKKFDVNDLDDLFDEIASNSTAIITLLSSNTEIFLEEYYNREISTEDHPVFIFDYHPILYYNSKNRTIYNNHYGLSSYSSNVYNELNIQREEFVDIFYGEKEQHMNADSAHLYIILFLDILLLHYFKKQLKVQEVLILIQ